MIILGIDPGSRKAGYGVIRLEGRKMTYVASGTMKYDGVSEFMDRLGHIYDSCAEIIKEHEPTEISIESLIYVKSVPSLAKLAQARGAMIAAFMPAYKSKVFEYTPNLVKSSVSGYGHASKDGITKSIKMILGQDLNFKTDDESDALAIAVCHALNRGQVVGQGKTKVSKGNTLGKVFKNYR